MHTLSRRQFVAGAAGVALAAGLRPALAGADLASIAIATRQIDVGGRSATVYALTQPDGTHGLSTELGRDFALRLENGLAEPSLVHWHGLTPPWRQDGVPGVSQDPLAPGAAQEYRFLNNRAGTHWMHSHLGLQEQGLLAAPLIVRDPAERGQDEQEVVVLLHDFSFRPAAEILADLRGGGHGMGGMNHGAMTGMSGMNHGAMAGMAMDINDIDHDAYLANDRTLDDPEVVAVDPGGRVRLRIINAAASTNFTIDLGAATGALIAVDGNPVDPVRASRFPVSIAQRLDIRLTVPPGAALPVLALREGAPERAGIVLQARGAAVERIAVAGGADGPVLDLGFEGALRALAPLAPRAPDRSAVVDLTGAMAGYAWGIAVDGAEGAALAVRAGERVELVLRNSTMMAHPMHLHGHHFQVVGIGGGRFAGALRDTVLVPPRTEVAVAFDADNPGRWAFHCHHIYHMAAGMMTRVDYADAV